MSNRHTENIETIIDRLLNDDTLTDTESKTLYEFLKTEDNRETFISILYAKIEMPAEHKVLPFRPQEWDSTLAKIMSEINKTSEKKQKSQIVSFWYKCTAVACIMATILIGGYYIKQWLANDKKIKNENIITANHKPDIAPGKVGGLLLLPSGKKLSLENLVKGTTLETEGVNITAVDSGIICRFTDSGIPEKHYVLTTPVSRIFKTTLEDGSIVWLNAASSLTLKNTFGTHRNISVSGECVIDLKHNALKPATVNTPYFNINDIGTVFDINCYIEEIYKTASVLSGKISVNNHTVYSGKQIRFDRQKKYNGLKNISQEHICGWLSGNFNFQEADIHDIMNQLCRWYNVRVEYAPNIEKQAKNHLFTGTIPMTSKFSEIIDILDFAGIKLKIKRVPSASSFGIVGVSF